MDGAKIPKSGCAKLLQLLVVVCLFGAIFGAIYGVAAIGERTEFDPAALRELLPTRPTPLPRPTPTPTATWGKLRAETIPYRNLFRYAEDHAGKLVYYRGKVVDVIENRDDFQLRVRVTLDDHGLWSDIIFVRWDNAPVRILEDDIIKFVGRVNGTITYKSVLGRNVVLPDVTALHMIIEPE